MPNHVKNRVRVHAFPVALGRYMTDGRLDFEKIIPPPPGVYLGNVGPVEKRLFGDRVWYDWCPRNWGTKWNAYGCEPIEREGDGDSTVCTLVFETACAAPHPVILALSQLLRARIEHSWACEGGCTWGHAVYSETGAIVSADFDGKVKGTLGGESRPPRDWPTMARELWGGVP